MKNKHETQMTEPVRSSDLVGPFMLRKTSASLPSCPSSPSRESRDESESISNLRAVKDEASRFVLQVPVRLQDETKLCEEESQEVWVKLDSGPPRPLREVLEEKRRSGQKGLA